MTAIWNPRQTCALIVRTLLFGGLSLQAQMLSLAGKRSQPELIWGVDSLAVIEEQGKSLQVCLSESGSPRKIQVPSDFFGVTFWQGVSTGVRMRNDQFFHSERRPDGTWIDSPILLGSHEFGFPLRLYETDSSRRLLGINVDVGFEKGGIASLVAWYRKLENGSLELDHPIHLEWGQPVFRAIPHVTGRKRPELSPDLKGLAPFLDYPLRVPGAFVIVSWRSGILWTVRDGDINASRTLDLIGIDPKLLRGDRPFPPVLLGLQPMKDGRILLAHRDPRAIKATPPPESAPGEDLSQPASDPYSRPPEFPAIFWKVWDPLTGSLEAASDSLLEQAPDTLRTERAPRMFTFGFDFTEKLIFPWKGLTPPPRLPSSAPEGTEGTSPGPVYPR